MRRRSFRNNAARNEFTRIVRRYWGAKLREGVDDAKQVTGHCGGCGRDQHADRSAGANHRRGCGGTVIIDDDEGIVVERRPAFREYIVRERVPNYTVPDQVIVGGVLPETGVTYYDVPQTFGVTPYRYTVVNGQTVLVEPRTRRIVQVVE